MTLNASPLISVIVPVHDVQDHVADCINSIARQTHTNFEALVINDGSTDDSAKMARDAIGDDARFRLISQENRGLSGARNRGLDEAAGQFIAFVDSDDSVTPDYLEQLLAAVLENDADWAACAIRFVGPDGGIATHSAIHGAPSLGSHPRTSRLALQDWLDVISHFPSAWNKLYRRELIGELRFDEGTWFEDHTFYYRAAVRTDHLVHVALPLYQQTRGRSGQITGRDDDRVFEQFPVLDEMHRIMRSTDVPCPKGGAETAFANITTRLLFERSASLHDPDRRAGFARASADYLSDNGLRYSPDWDDGISRLWAQEMIGDLPMSVVIPWHGDHPNLLTRTLDSLARQNGPGREVLIVVDTQSAADSAAGIAANHPAARVVQQNTKGTGTARNFGLKTAKGRTIVFLDAGDRLAEGALHAWSETLADSGADFGISQYRMGLGAGPVHTGFHARRDRPLPKVTDKVFRPGPDMALDLDIPVSAMIFDRAFLVDNGLHFASGARPDLPVILGAASLAKSATYSNWAGVEIDLAPEARRLWGAVPTVTAIAQSINRTKDALPGGLKDTLPTDWRLRLRSRTIWEQVYHGTPGNRLARLRFLATTALYSLYRGAIERPVTRSAQMDPLIGPKTLLLSMPWDTGLIRKVLRPAPEHIDVSVQETELMLPFEPQKGIRYRYRADFYADSFANISFLNADATRILFHLSLRQDQGLAVCNTRQGAIWGREVPKKVHFASSTVEVEIRFELPRIEVWIDGRRVFSLGGLFGALRFKHGDLIRWVDFQGGIRPAGFVIREAKTAELPSDGSPVLTQQLMLRKALPNPADQSGEYGLRLPDGEIVAAQVRQTPDGFVNLNAILPGRVWAALQSDEVQDLNFLRPDGEVIEPPFEVDRPRLQRRISEALDHPSLRADTFTAMQILEHARHGGLYDTLDQNQRDNLHRTARFYRLENYLVDGQGEGAAVPPSDVQHPIVDPIWEILSRFRQTLASSPDLSPIALLVELAPENPDQRRDLAFALCDFFCREGQDFDAFFALTHDWVRDALELSDDPWFNSVALPFHIKRGDFDTANEILEMLKKPTTAWIATPALAWMMRHLMVDPKVHSPERDSLLVAFLDFVDARLGIYFERSQCDEMIRAMALLVRSQNRFGPRSAKRITPAAIRAYGLSRVFWDAIGETDDSDGIQTAAKQAFETIRRYAGDVSAPAIDMPLEAAFAFFERLKCPDLARIRVELADLMPNQILIENHDALRSVARPLTGMQSGPAIPMATAEISDAYTEIARASHYDVQKLVGRALVAPVADQMSDIHTILDNLSLISGSDSGFLGIGLAISRLVELTNDTENSMRGLLVDWLGDTVGALNDPPHLIREAPAVKMALSKLEDKSLSDRISGIIGQWHDAPLAHANRDQIIPNPSAVFDTIVVVFSCKPNLETRIPAMRSGWLSRLQGLGVPYIIVVGDGDDSREGDVVRLNAPDDYEGLPQKTLAAIRWVHDHTAYAHMLKIDDDCFLNVDEFFHSLSYRKFDYYGRKLTRHRGQTDRAWHREKSSSRRGQTELDKSPEPSTYADGGSGYVLSRTAMDRALMVANEPVGRTLIQTSFMEDKLLGDLLSLGGISPSDEDYRITVRRRTHGDAIPVARWVNSFDASASVPVKLTHLDTHHGQDQADAQLRETAFKPPRIWPSSQKPKLGYQSNALELISPEDRVRRAIEADVAVVACMRNEMFMLPHFLSHYRDLGVGAFLIADNLSDDGTLEYLADQPDVALFSVDTDYQISQYGVAWQQTMLSEFRRGKWSVVADADELLVWQQPQSQTLPDLVKGPEFADADAARIFMLDMYPKGPLEKATFDTNTPFDQAGFTDRVPFLSDWPGRGPYSNSDTWTSALRHRLIKGARPDLFVAQKYALLRYQPWMRLSAGLHFAADIRLADRQLLFAHFKYNADFRRKAQAEVARGQHFNDAEEYHRYLALISEGRDQIFDPAISVPWTQSSFARKILGD